MRFKMAKLLAGCVAVIAIAACNKAPVNETGANPQATAGNASQGADAATAAVQEKEAELARREADLAEREAKAAAASTKAPSRPASSRPPAPRPTTNNPPPAVTNSPVAPPVTPATLVVPTGTQLPLSLVTALSSKTAKVGDPVRARVTEDVRVNDRVAIAAGTTVAGSVTDVVSGSSKIGGVPTLGLRFERLELPGNVDVPIDGVLTQKGKSDTGRDTAKIVGGAAAGAILGHQVKSGDKGKVLGGLLGGAIGAVAAQKTGTEVTLDEGTAFSIALAAPVEITRR